MPLPFLQGPDAPLSNLVLLFLAAFLLIGISPFLGKVVARMRGSSGRPGRPKEPGRAALEQPSGEMNEPLHLNAYEAIVLRRLAQAGRRGVSLRSVDTDLGIAPSLIASALESLHARGFVRLAITLLGRTRVHLSGKGRGYAQEHGYVPTLGSWH
ncbi:MAG: hypothetical protein C0617_09940 [Desulfuromonas sp.]|uniref:hypothetical protein n=1 Tax=Desulfuromonas sp. TaxID=892 RepID=UPI000CCB2338|nr:hypothetical protein [Desulfuromonas sp.]PLX83840.1 MAG: hypothetical protein C0617_09940 [Desulfuromonas sp.]